ncbi:MAG: fatty acid desaturase [Verrucomicrobiota bacterium]
MFKYIPFDRVIWPTTIFLFGTLILALTAVPVYVYFQGIDLFMLGLLLFYITATAMSITLGYHRLFSHLAFKAKFPVKLFVTLFGAAAWENSVIDWTSDHRRHHKHVDHDEDPYNINNGFWYAHMGWMLFKLRPKPPMDNVYDLRKDPLLVWQHKYVHVIAVLVGFVLPAIIAGLYYGTWMGALGGFLIAGILRTVIVQHCTFFINSACHYFGSQPYSSKHSARDSWIMALLTFGEGYHNFHHEFQHDYRNGVKSWQWDPTKWAIWLLAKVGMASGLRRVSDARILMAEIQETKLKIDHGLEVAMAKADWAHTASEQLKKSVDYLSKASDEFSIHYTELERAVSDKVKLSRKKVDEWRHDIQKALDHLEVLYSCRLSAA